MNKNDESRKGRETLWDLISPLWILRAMPQEFRQPGICLGPFYLQGCFGLLVFHMLTAGAFLAEVIVHGYQRVLLLYLVPLIPLWLFVIVVDLKFRLQRPTSGQRLGFDSAVMNWFGMLSVAASWVMAIGMFVWFMLKLGKRIGT